MSLQLAWNGIFITVSMYNEKLELYKVDATREEKGLPLQ